MTAAVSSPARDGYDLPVYGLETDQFYALHIPALTCICLSLVSVVYVLVASFRGDTSNFYMRTTAERFIVYLAVCDGMFNICHSIDHLHILITRDHVKPRALCVFYGIMLTEFITAQNLMVNVAAIHVFVLIYCRRKINFGSRDWKLLLWTFGFPCLAALCTIPTNSFGTNGAFCHFDMVNGKLANLLFTTIPLVVIFVVNIVLYVISYGRIRREEPHFKRAKGHPARVRRASFCAARNMSLLVVAFVVQWSAFTVYGVYNIFGASEPILLHTVTTFVNIGGILNFFVFLIVRRRRLDNAPNDQQRNSTSSAYFSRRDDKTDVLGTVIALDSSPPATIDRTGK